MAVFPGLYDLTISDTLFYHIGIKPDSFLTIVDEDDDDPFVNVVINIQEA